MRAGTLRHCLRIERRTETRDAYGGIVEAWEPLATAYADLHQLSGRALYAAQQSHPTVTARAILRYRPLPDSGLRVWRDAELYELEAPPIDPDGRRRELHLLLRRGVISGAA